MFFVDLFHKLTKRSKRVLWIVLSAVFTVLCAALIAGTAIAVSFETVVNLFFHIQASEIVGGDGEDYFTSAYSSYADVQAANYALCEEVEAEGAVLLLNRNNALPLAEGSKISGLGKTTVQLVTGGTGSGSVATTGKTTFKSAMTDAGFSVNPTLWDFYSSDRIKSKYQLVLTSNSDLNNVISGNQGVTVNEVPMSEYSSTEWDSVAEYGDAVIVMFSRNSGEGRDLPWVGTGEGSGNILELTPEEQALLAKAKAMKDSGAVKKIVVLLNSSYQLELDFLEPSLCGSDYGIDACLWIGGTGETGINAVGDILAGKVNPSGKLTNTYCYDNLTSPAIQNAHVTAYTNGESKGLAFTGGNNLFYVAYQEGIYVGYRYYETRYEDYVLGNGNVGSYDYASTVAYPFGYGLSYSVFEYSDFYMEPVKDGDTELVFNVNVTNTSLVDGKETVTVYMQSPYTEYDKNNLIEKSAIELVGFSKISVPAGETVTATVKVDMTELRAYDANNAKTYILDAGNYYFSVGNGAHEALNNVLMKKAECGDASNGAVDTEKMVGTGDSSLAVQYVVNGTAPDTTIFSLSEATGAEIVNRFDHADLNKYDSDTSNDIVYLTRSDWAGTMPKAVINTAKDINISNLSDSGYQAAFQMAATDQMVKDLQVNYTKSTDGTLPKMNQKNGLELIQFRGVEYGESITVDGKEYTWDDLLDQLTFTDMANLIGRGYHSTYYIKSIAKPATTDENGPQGISMAIYGGSTGTAFPSSDVRAATFNPELNERMGKGFGEDAFAAGLSGLYGTGANTHRTPYSGRNFEYYSEDPLLGGKTGAAEIKGIQSMGVYCYIKHFALNDQETGRDGLCVWSNEQAIREIYLEPFERIVEEGGAYCVMTSFTRLGCTWAGADSSLLTDVLRGEFGMRGMAITDYSANTYMDVKIGIIAGSDIWDCSQNKWSLELNNYKDDPVIVNAMRTACQRILYTVVNSRAMNGMGKGSQIISVTPWWKSTLIALDVIFGVVAVLSIIFLILNFVLNKTDKERPVRQTLNNNQE